MVNDLDIEARIMSLVDNAIKWALTCPESWDKHGALDDDLFGGLLSDAIAETIIRPILQS